MHRIGVSLIAVMSILVVINSSSPAHAKARVKTLEISNPWTSTVKAVVTTSGRPVQTSSGSPAQNGNTTGRNTTAAQTNPCRTITASPQPPKSDPVWAGHRTGKILVQPCWLLLQMDVHPFWAPAAAKTAAGPAISPAVLARQALAELQMPSPVIRRSPGKSVTDDAGVPVTWVNLWTWVWTTRASWRPLSKTASLNPVWAKVTVTPRALVFHPGQGATAVPCAGQGRAWTPADADAAPTRGGCGYMYRSVGPVTAALTIRWAVSWTGSGGTSGRLPAMTTQATDQFTVEQTQVVQR